MLFAIVFLLMQGKCCSKTLLSRPINLQCNNLMSVFQFNAKFQYSLYDVAYSIVSFYIILKNV